MISRKSAEMRPHISICCTVIVLFSATAAMHVAHEASNHDRVASSVDDAKNSTDQFTCPTSICECKNLVSFDCRERKLSKAPADLPDGLTTLDVSSNEIKDLDVNTFARYKRLKVLRARNNRIDNIGDGAFVKEPALQVLLLDRNALTEVNGRWLFGLANLRRLSLNHNKISHINGSHWHFVSALANLSIAHNELEIIGDNFFADLTKLQELRLNNNKIHMIHPRAFASLKSLKVLDLRHNNLNIALQAISSIFTGLSSVQRLDLSFNSVDSVRHDCFAGLDNLQSLHFSGNPVRTLPKAAFDSLKSLSEFQIDSQDLTCDCHMVWLAIKYQSGQYSGAGDAGCASPSLLEGAKLRQIEDTENWRFSCQGPSKPVLVADKPEVGPKFVLGRSSFLKCYALVHRSLKEETTISWILDNRYLDNPEGSSDNPPYTFSVDVQENFDDSGKVMLTGTVEIANITVQDAGEYQCSVSNDYGDVYSSVSKVNVYQFPSVIARPRNLVTYPGGTINLMCQASGDPKPTISWKFIGAVPGKAPAGVQRRMDYRVEDDKNIMTIKPVTQDDHGVYQCEATNDIGTISANISVTVLPHKNHVPNPISRVCVSGDPIIMECPMMDNRHGVWTRDGQVIRSNHYLRIHQSTMEIYRCQTTDMSTYKCVLPNVVGGVNIGGDQSYPPHQPYHIVNLSVLPRPSVKQALLRTSASTQQGLGPIDPLIFNTIGVVIVCLIVMLGIVGFVMHRLITLRRAMSDTKSASSSTDTLSC